MTQIIDFEDLAISLGHEFHLCDALIRECGLRPGKLILEAGCGSGKLSLNLVMRTKASAFLVDNDPATVDRALRNLAGVEALTSSRFPVIIEAIDITQLPYNERTFDLVFNEGVLEHFSDPAAVLKMMARVSRDFVAASVPNAENAKQVLLAEKQTAEYTGKPHWAAYEKPMNIDELAGHMKAADLKDVKVGYIWRDSTEPEEDPSQFRLLLGMGRV